VVTVGFGRTAYSVSEDADSVSVTVSVQAGTLDRDVVVTLSTVNGTAMCKFQSETQQQLLIYFSHVLVSV